MIDQELLLKHMCETLDDIRGSALKMAEASSHMELAAARGDWVRGNQQFTALVKKRDEYLKSQIKD
jgi:hypothetical protein